MHLIGEFERRESLVQALDALKVIGISPNDLDVFSDVPLEIPRSVLDRRSHMSLAVVIGAITAGLLIVWFVYFTQHDYPIVTGGMPIFSFWATGVVFYELTMLGAIVTSLFWFIHESGILRRKRRIRPQFQGGSMCVQIHCAAEQQDEVRRLLETAGASNFRSAGDVP